MKIVNFPRFIISISLLACLISFVISMATTKVFSASPVEYDKIVVSAGDTLWSIALDLDGDIKENIYNIKKVNKLIDPIIYEGQELLIPIQEK